MGILNLKDDLINTAMVDGITIAFKDDLKKILMETAEKEVDEVINNLCKRIEYTLQNDEKAFCGERHIKLLWLIKHTEPV